MPASERMRATAANVDKRMVENRRGAVKVEMHGDLAITYGRYVGNIPSSGEGRAWFAVWYEKIYAKRYGRWLYLSHRTVHGATYGLDRQSVSDK